jgi:thiol-disulfide isomerase/thioredoxin
MEYIQSTVEKLSHQITHQVNTNKKFICIMAVVLVCIIAAIFISRKYLLPKVNSIQTSMDSVMSSSEVEGMDAGGSQDVYFFHVTWCPHCKTAKPEWDKVVSNNESNTNIKFHDIDCDKSPDLAKQYNVESYPTILKDSSGTIDEFKQKPSESALQQFIDG